jgi:hypothetical protein
MAITSCMWAGVGGGLARRQGGGPFLSSPCRDHSQLDGLAGPLCRGGYEGGGQGRGQVGTARLVVLVMSSYSMQSSGDVWLWSSPKSSSFFSLATIEAQLW